MNGRDRGPTLRRLNGFTIFGLILAGVVGACFALIAEEPRPRADDDREAGTRRDAILGGEAWRNTLNRLDEWLSIQPIYDAQQAEQAKSRLLGRTKKMRVDELEAFQQDLDAKLQMVLGPEGRDILNWVAANYAAAAPAYRKHLDLQYPDLLNVTAAQLREQLDLLERKRSTAQNRSAALEQTRQARITALQAEQRQQYDQRERALDRGAASYGAAGYRSPYHPGGMRQYPDVVARSPFAFGIGIW